MTLSWHERRVVATDSSDTIADGVAGRCPIAPSSRLGNCQPLGGVDGVCSHAGAVGVCECGRACR